MRQPRLIAMRRTYFASADFGSRKGFKGGKKILGEAQAFLAKRPKKLAITGCRFSPG
jgi:hypothetical protein